jgi:spore photoproduct lyase
VKKDPRAVARVERMMAKIETPSITEGITDDELDAIVNEAGWRDSRRLTGIKKVEDPIVILNAFDFDLQKNDRRQGGRDIYRGGGGWALRDRERVMQSARTVCQTAYELHTARGCLFKCDYCYLQNALNIMVNIEAYVEQLADLVEKSPQTLYKWDSQSDILTFEPEYDAARPMGEFFGRQEKAFLMHYTKSDNVDVLKDIDHNGQTMVCWSLTAHTQSRVIEGDTANTEERIEAMRKCQSWGYPVRCRLSPVIPVKNWREECRAMLELLFEKAQPEVISLQTLSRFPEYEMLPRTLDLDLLDPTFVKAAQDEKEEMAGQIVGPLPHYKRAEMYKFLIDELKRLSPETPFSICLESPEMWEELGELMGESPSAYACCCGPVCTPGQPIMAPKVR